MAMVDTSLDVQARFEAEVSNVDHLKDYDAIK